MYRYSWIAVILLLYVSTLPLCYTYIEDNLKQNQKCQWKYILCFKNHNSTLSHLYSTISDGIFRNKIHISIPKWKKRQVFNTILQSKLKTYIASRLHVQKIVSSKIKTSFRISHPKYRNPVFWDEDVFTQDLERTWNSNWVKTTPEKQTWLRWHCNQPQI